MGDSDFVGRLFGQPGSMRQQRRATGPRPWEQRNIAGVSGANQPDFAPGNPGLWTPGSGPAGSQTYHPFNLTPAVPQPDVTGWNRQSPPQLFWPNRDVNQFPVWPYPGPSLIEPPVVPPPGGGTAPPPGGTIPPGYPPGTPPGVVGSYPPSAFGPQPGPSTGAGGDTGEDSSGPPGGGGTGGGFGFGGFSVSPNFSGRGISFGGALGQGLDALGLGPVASNVANVALSVLGGPFAGIVNAGLGGIIGGVRGYNAMQNLNLLSMLARAPRSSVGDVDPNIGLTPTLNDLAVQAEHGGTGETGPPGIDTGVTGPTGVTSGQSGEPGGPPGDVGVRGGGGSGGGDGPGGGGPRGGGGGAGDAGSGPGDPGGPFHRGGMIPNRGMSQLETVPITAKEGEFVVRPEAVRKFAPILEWMNNAPSQASPEHLIRLIAMAKTMDQHRGRA